MESLITLVWSLALAVLASLPCIIFWCEVSDHIRN
jgi:hypothetical protein